jgi:hypothetical protein
VGQDGRRLVELIVAKVPFMIPLASGRIAFRHGEHVIIIMSTKMVNPKFRLLLARGKQRGPFKKEGLWEIFDDGSIRDKNGSAASRESLVFFFSALEALKERAATPPSEVSTLQVLYAV